MNVPVPLMGQEEVDGPPGRAEPEDPAGHAPYARRTAAPDPWRLAQLLAGRQNGTIWMPLPVQPRPMPAPPIRP